MSMKANNHRAKQASYQKAGREARARRAEELANGAKLNSREKALRLEQEIAEFEERVGVNGVRPSEKGKYKFGVVGPNSRNAFTDPSLVQDHYGQEE